MASAVQAPLENLVLTDPEPSVRVLHSQLRVLVLVKGRDPSLVVSRSVAVFSGLGRLPVSGWRGSKVFK